MDEISEFDAQSDLKTLLDQVEQGREVIITRDGRPMARLVAVDEVARAREGAAELRQLKAEIAARGGLMSWAELKAYRDEGRS